MISEWIRNFLVAKCYSQREKLNILQTECQNEANKRFQRDTDLMPKYRKMMRKWCRDDTRIIPTWPEKYAKNQPKRIQNEMKMVIWYRNDIHVILTWWQKDAWSPKIPPLTRFSGLEKVFANSCTECTAPLKHTQACAIGLLQKSTHSHKMTPARDPKQISFFVCFCLLSSTPGSDSQHQVACIW